MGYIQINGVLLAVKGEFEIDEIRRNKLKALSLEKRFPVRPCSAFWGLFIQQGNYHHPNKNCNASLTVK